MDDMDEMNEEIGEIAKHYGLWFQVEKLSEECAELIAAEIQLCTKQDTVDRRELLHRYLSELADVDIVLEQVKFLLSPSMRSYFYDVREDKIIRTLKRIEAEKR